MIKQIRKIFIVLIAFIIILISFLIPQLLMKIEDINMENKIFTKAKTKNKIDIQAEKIYLVQALHQLYNGSMNMKVSKREKVYYNKNEYIEVQPSSTGEGEKGIEIVQSNSENGKVLNEKNIEDIKNEIAKLEKSNILKNWNLEDDNIKYSLEFFTATYLDNQNAYEVVIKYYEFESEDYKIGMEIEEKTGKIVFVHIPESILKLESERKELLENYIKYLDLYIIDDWEYEDRYLKSEKAQLTAILLDGSNGEYILTIQPINQIEENNEISQ